MELSRLLKIWETRTLKELCAQFAEGNGMRRESDAPEDFAERRKKFLALANLILFDPNGSEAGGTGTPEERFSSFFFFRPRLPNRKDSSASCSVTIEDILGTILERERSGVDSAPDEARAFLKNGLPSDTPAIYESFVAFAQSDPDLLESVFELALSGPEEKNGELLQMLLAGKGDVFECRRPGDAWKDLVEKCVLSTDDLPEIADAWKGTKRRRRKTLDAVEELLDSSPDAEFASRVPAFLGFDERSARTDERVAALAEKAARMLATIEEESCGSDCPAL